MLPGLPNPKRLRRLFRVIQWVVPTVVLAGMIGSSAADQVFSQDRARIAPKAYPVTELRMVREPGNYHFIQTNDGEYILSDYWWREVKTGDRRYTGGAVNPLPPPGPVPPPGGGGFPAPGQIRKVFVEIVGGRGYEFFGRERIRPTSFTLFEDLPRNVQVRYGNSRGTLQAVFDGYHVDLNLERAAKVIPGFNGAVQSLGDGQGLDDVEVVVYWEEDARGEPLYYREGAAAEDPDQWGVNLKSKVMSTRPADPQGPVPSAPLAPVPPSAPSAPLERSGP